MTMETKETKPKKGSHFDLFFKCIFSHLPSAKELFGLVFSKMEMALFDWDQLQVAKDSWHGKRADLVFMVPLTNCGIYVKIHILLEHKSQYNRAVFYQLLNYQTFILRQVFQETGKACVVIPVLFYHGKEPWKWPTNFQEGLWEADSTKIPLFLRQRMLNYGLWALDTHTEKVAKAIQNKHTKIRGALNALKSAWDFKADEDMLSEALSLFDNWTGDKDDLLMNLGNYFWSVVPGMNRELWTKLESLAVKRGIFSKGGYMDIREYMREEARQEVREEARQEVREEARQEGWQKGQQDGIQKGMQQGMQQERQQVASNMLKEKADLSFICKVTGLSEEKLKKLKNSS